jgi:hypothetical protein
MTFLLLNVSLNFFPKNGENTQKMGKITQKWAKYLFNLT